MYPALNIPTRVSDLTAIERGNKIDIHFTIPPLTTEGLTVKEIVSIELRVGPNAGPGFQTDPWASGADRIPVTPPSQPFAVHAEVPIQKYIGKEVVVAVRAGNARGRMSDWSNIIVLPVEQPLPTPTAFEAQPVPEGVRLTWTAANTATFRLFRKSGTDQEPSVLGNSDKPEYIDTATEYGKTYEYYVEGMHNKTESEITGPKTITPKDKFAPHVPVGLNASAGIGSVELAWERNTESDFKEYRVYRAGPDGAFTQIAEGLDGPSYSDRKVEAGKRYRYRVTALDQTGNESVPCSPVEIIAP
jgi:hypothetical protein